MLLFDQSNKREQKFAWSSTSRAISNYLQVPPDTVLEFLRLGDHAPNLLGKSSLVPWLPQIFNVACRKRREPGHMPDKGLELRCALTMTQLVSCTRLWFRCLFLANVDRWKIDDLSRAMITQLAKSPSLNIHGTNSSHLWTDVHPQNDEFSWTPKARHWSDAKIIGGTLTLSLSMMIHRVMVSVCCHPNCMSCTW